MITRKSYTKKFKIKILKQNGIISSDGMIFTEKKYELGSGTLLKTGKDF